MADANALLADVAKLRGSVDSALGNLTQYKTAVKETEKLLAATGSQHKASSKELAQLEKKLAALKKSAGSSSGGATDEQIQQLSDAIAAARADLGLVEAIQPSTGSLFVRLFLGQVNVRVASKKDAETLRDEYDKFKDRTNIIFLFFPLLWILTQTYLQHIWAYTDWIYISTHVWLLYYYVSLALRENILRVNGSRIRGWWITHHYISASMSIITMSWPTDSTSWKLFTRQFTFYFLYQAVVQFMQARYQKSRHYAIRALGKRSHMDVSTTETLTEFHSGLIGILLLVFIAQIWQMYNGWSLLRILLVDLDFSGNIASGSWYAFREEVQCALLAPSFFYLGLMNFLVTISTMKDKFSKGGRKSSSSSSSGSGGAGMRGSGSGSNLSISAGGGGGALGRSPVGTPLVATPGGIGSSPVPVIAPAGLPAGLEPVLEEQQPAVEGKKGQ